MAYAPVDPAENSSPQLQIHDTTPVGIVGRHLFLSQRNRRRLIAVLAAVWLVVVLFGVLIVANGWPDIVFSLDFASFWSGAALVRDGVGSGLYDLQRQAAFQQTVHAEQATGFEMWQVQGFVPYWNPPPLLLLFIPISLLPIAWGYLVWLVVSLLAFVLAVAVPLRGVSHGRRTAVALLAYAGVAGTLLEGQVNGVLILALSLGLMAFSTQRRVLGGVLFGLMWLKPQYALLFPFIFLLKKRWVELAAMSMVGLSIALLSVAMIGIDGMARYLAVLQRIGGFYPSPEFLISPGAMSNWRGLLINLFPALPGDMGGLLLYGLGGATLAASLLVWKGPWAPSSLRFSVQMLVAILATIVASTHSHFHGTVLLLVPLAVAVGRAKQVSTLESRWMVMLASGYLLGMAVWMVRSMSWMLVPYFLVLMAMLIRACWGSAVMEESS